MNRYPIITALAVWFVSGMAYAQENMVTVPAARPVARMPAQQPDNMVMMPEENIVMLPNTQATPAQNTSGLTPITGNNYVEGGINVHNVSNGYGNWFGQFVTGEIQTDPDNRWRARLEHQQAFHEHGESMSIGNVHQFDDRWFSDVGVGFGSDVSFLSKYRVDAAINRRLLEEGNLLATVGTTYTEANETYSSIGGFFGLSYYFPNPWIIQTGIRTDISDPGSVAATSGFVAVTYGFQKRYYMTVRLGYGREAYQLLGSGNSITNSFYSHNAGFNWRHWLGPEWGYNLGGEYYNNPAYHRTGMIISVFKEF